MKIHLKKCFTLIAAAVTGVSLFFYTRYSRQEVRRLRAGARMVATRRGPVEVAERGQGDPVLVIQGSTGGYNLGLYLAWPDTGFHYIIPSRPGFLRTPLNKAVTPEEQSDLLAALLDTLNIQRAAVIALSGCGPQIFQLALRHPERITCLVLVSVASLPIALPVLLLRIARALLRYSPFLPGIILRRPPGNILISPRRKAAAHRPNRINELRRLLSVVFPVTPRLMGMLNDVYWMVKNPDYPIHQILTPTLVIHGDDDMVVPLEHANYSASCIPSAQLAVVPGGGHLAFAVLKDEVKQIAVEFIRQHTGESFA
jgi:pimeloyl-ACP methyl ester carboxylesterase